MDAQDFLSLQEAYNQVYAPTSEEWRQSIVEGTAAIRANVPQPGTRTARITATGEEPAGDRLVRRAGEAIGKFLGSRGVQKIEPAPPQRKPLVSTTKKEEIDLFNIILSHLLDEGYADTNESALAIMTNMSEEWRQSIVEGGFNSSGRYDVGDGRTVGPVAGVIRSLFSGKLPQQKTYIPPFPRQGTNTPPAVPASRGDSGKLTDFGAGGGKAKLKTGMSVGQVERQGRINKGDSSG